MIPRHEACASVLKTFHTANGEKMPQKTAAVTGFVQPVILRVDSLVKIYGKRRVVDGVSFEVRKGEIVGLLGPNGAGKTTSFRMACGLINTNGGVVYLGTQDVTNWPMYRRSREGGMGYLPQEKSVFQKLSVQNNLLGVMEMLGIKRSVRKKRCDELLEKLQLTHLRYNYAGGLSGGERRRLEIARSLVSDPKIILLDEPFAAVDPITVTSIQEIIRQLAREGISILITDHSVQDTLQITQHSYVIQAGRVLCHGTPQEVLANPEARKVYFGENVSVSGIHHVSLFGDSAVRPPVPTSEDYGDDGTTKSAEEKENLQEEYAPTVPPPKFLHVKQNAAGGVGQKLAAPTSGVPLPDKVVGHDEGALLQAERINRRQHLISDGTETKTRRLGRRVSPISMDARPDRPFVRSKEIPQKEPPQMPVASSGSDEDTSSMSGVIQSLRSLIWKK